MANTKIVKSGRSLVRVGQIVPSTFKERPVLTLSSSYMVKHSTGASILVYSAEVRAPQDLNVCTKVGDTEVRLAPSSVTFNGTTLTWPETFLSVSVPSYTYILLESNTGVISQSSTYLDDYVLIAIVQTSGSAIERIYNFRDGAKLIFYKKQVFNGTDWEWSAGGAHPLGAGVDPKYSFDEGILTILFAKNGSLYRRTVDVEGNISEFQYKEDYPINNSIVQPDPFENILRSCPCSQSSSNVSVYVPYAISTPAEGNLFNIDGTVEGYYVSVPYLISRAQLGLGYSRVDSIQLYDENFILLQTIDIEDCGDLIRLSGSSPIYYLGFSGAYSVYTSERFASAYAASKESSIEVIPGDETDNFKELSRTNTSSIEGGFTLTKTLVYMNKLTEENSVSMVSAEGYSMNTKTFSVTTKTVEEEATVNVACTENTFTIL